MIFWSLGCGLEHCLPSEFDDAFKDLPFYSKALSSTALFSPLLSGSSPPPIQAPLQYKPVLCLKWKLHNHKYKIVYLKSSHFSHMKKVIWKCSEFPPTIKVRSTTQTKGVKVLLGLNEAVRVALFFFLAFSQMFSAISWASQMKETWVQEAC